MWIITWHTGDGEHAYSSVREVMIAMRYQPYKGATVTHFKGGKIIEQFMVQESKP